MRRICLIILSVVLVMGMTVSVFALPDKSNYDPQPNQTTTAAGFYNVGTASGVSVKPAASSGEITAIHADIDGTAPYAYEDFYPNSDRLLVSYNGATVGKYYLVVLVEGTTLPTNESEVSRIYYVNQATATGTTVEFTVFPSEISADKPTMTLFIKSNDGVSIPTVSMSYCVSGTEHWIEPSAVSGVTVSGSVTTHKDGDTTITLKSGGTTVDSKVVSGATGNYSFESVPDGDYTLEVAKTNHVTRVYDITVAGVALTHNVEICVQGDINNDGNVDILDYQRLFSHLNGSNPLLEAYQLLMADVNNDGYKDILDYQRLFSHLNGSNPLW